MYCMYQCTLLPSSPQAPDCLTRTNSVMGLIDANAMRMTATTCRDRRRCGRRHRDRRPHRRPFPEDVVVVQREAAPALSDGRQRRRRGARSPRVQLVRKGGPRKATCATGAAATPAASGAAQRGAGAATATGGAREATEAPGAESPGGGQRLPPPSRPLAAAAARRRRRRRRSRQDDSSGSEGGDDSDSSSSSSSSSGGGGGGGGGLRRRAPRRLASVASGVGVATRRAITTIGGNVDGAPRGELPPPTRPRPRPPPPPPTTQPRSPPPHATTSPSRRRAPGTPPALDSLEALAAQLGVSVRGSGGTRGGGTRRG